MLAHPPKLMSSQRENGTGLGLAGVFANVQAFGGEIHLSNNDAGAHIVIEFPRLSSNDCKNATQLQHVSKIHLYNGSEIR